MKTILRACRCCRTRIVTMSSNYNPLFQCVIDHLVIPNISKGVIVMLVYNLMSPAYIWPHHMSLDLINLFISGLFMGLIYWQSIFLLEFSQNKLLLWNHVFCWYLDSEKSSCRFCLNENCVATLRIKVITILRSCCFSLVP